jgi:putative ABC transport system substrate-binding protein
MKSSGRRVPRGVKSPYQLAVQAPIKFDLAINLKTTEAIGVTVPSEIIARADEVIE